MSFVSDYTFNNMGRIGSDITDNTQRNLQNTKQANYLFSDFVSGNLSDSHVKFATSNLTTNFTGLTHGTGLNGNLVDVDSSLMLKKGEDRPLEKLHLMQRPFLTVPFLGKGSCDTTLESQLLQGDTVLQDTKKSTSTIMTQSFMGYTLYPTDSQMEEQINNPAYKVEEAALQGWVRGGASSREMGNSSSK